MKIYYEVQDSEGAVRSFPALEDAVIFADENGSKLISEVGGSWTDYGKCWFCEDWYDVCDINRGGTCSRCERCIEDHNGPQE